jgi:hypothetical protein
MRREWEPEDLVGSWTLVEDDWRLIGNKTGATRLGFALLLKFFELEARFPRHGGELPPAAVDYVAAQVGVEPALAGACGWTGRTIEYHRAQIRDALGFRPATRPDEEALAGWLATEVAPAEPSDDRLREALLTRCRNEHLEPPGRVDRLVASARATATDRFCAATVARLHQGAADRLERASPAPTTGRCSTTSAARHARTGRAGVVPATAAASGPGAAPPAPPPGGSRSALAGPARRSRGGRPGRPRPSRLEQGTTPSPSPQAGGSGWATWNRRVGIAASSGEPGQAIAAALTSLHPRAQALGRRLSRRPLDVPPRTPPP